MSLLFITHHKIQSMTSLKFSGEKKKIFGGGHVKIWTHSIKLNNYYRWNVVKEREMFDRFLKVYFIVIKFCFNNI